MNFKTRGLVVGGINTVACVVASLSRGKMDFFCCIHVHSEKHELHNKKIGFSIYITQNYAADIYEYIFKIPSLLDEIVLHHYPLPSVSIINVYGPTFNKNMSLSVMGPLIS